MNSNVFTYDPDYARRHPARNARKVSAIVNNVPSRNSALDIGCNKGYVLSGLLHAGRIQLAHGLEPCRDIIEPALLNDTRFRLFDCDLVEFRFSQCYDIVIYNAVHHHIIGRFGVRAADFLWQEIVDHCSETLIFETGLIAEHGEYYWKDELKRCFRTDEEYLRSLFHAVGPRLKSIETIAVLPIHGTVRTLYKMTLHELMGERDIKGSSKIFYDGRDVDTSAWRVMKQFRRTIGSRAQELVELTSQKDGSPSLWNGTEFFLLAPPDGEPLVLGKKPTCPYKQMREFRIAEAISMPNVIKLIGVSEQYGLLLPYLEGWAKFQDLDFRHIENGSWFLRTFDELLENLSEEVVDMGVLNFPPSDPFPRKFAINLVDVHLSNILLQLNDRRIVDWTLIDLEYFANENASRNWRHRHMVESHVRKAEGLRLRAVAKNCLELIRRWRAAFSRTKDS